MSCRCCGRPDCVMGRDDQAQRIAALEAQVVGLKWAGDELLRWLTRSIGWTEEACKEIDRDTGNWVEARDAIPAEALAKWQAVERAIDNLAREWPDAKMSPRLNEYLIKLLEARADVGDVGVRRG